MTPSQKRFGLSCALAAVLLSAACSPTVKVETPDKPITINMNINISHEIRMKVDKDLENTFEKNESIF
ncbi:MAG: YnbE family lipoprotein [Alphaproteobacteria bacterium]|nr:YnbE family lipoprotein [Alphaproteobacteria bacterium]